MNVTISEWNIGARRFAFLLLGVLLAVAGCARSDAPVESPWVTEADRHDPVVDATGKVIRYGPIITSDMLPGDDGRNINSPWLVRAPEWATNRLGRYYLYFSMHGGGRYIRLAYADEITGPWHIHEPGVFRSEQGPSPDGNVSAPSVIVDDDRQLVVLYFNTRLPPDRRPSQTFVATSSCGLAFDYVGGPIGPAYSAVLQHEGWYYVFMGASGQTVFRSRDGLSDFERGPQVLPSRQGDTDPYSRHVAVQRKDDVLRVYYTRKRDAPESVLMGTIQLADEWQSWTVDHTVEVMRPEMRYEGGDLPVTPSRHGPARRPERALRDPAIFEEDGRTWLLYTYAGEQGIALAELLF